MKLTAPHYLLFTQTNEPPEGQQPGGRWRFVLEEVGSTRRIDESSWEPGFRGERLELLAVVRGLECLEQPSLVTLVTPSRFVGRGIRSGLRQWKAHNWTWEELGQTHPVRHQDLWQRIDAALEFHQVSCRVWHFDPPHAVGSKSAEQESAAAGSQRAGQSTTNFETALPGQDRPRGRNRICLVPPESRASAPAAGAGLLRRGTDSLARIAESASSSSQTLLDRIKPLGQGRAYGYAVN